jgi:AMP deaminase
MLGQMTSRTLINFLLAFDRFTNSLQLVRHLCSPHQGSSHCLRVIANVDMCELARNSVLQSGWEMQVKKHWLGNKWYLPGVAGNDIDKVFATSVVMLFDLC